jgi:hypothetical protein
MNNCMLLTLLFLNTVITSCNGQNNLKESIVVEAYSSYTGSTMPSTIEVTSSISNYDSTINYTLNLIGLPNSDIEIETTPTFGAFSIINRLNQRRFFVYCPSFLDSVFKVTQTDFAILSICFHELAHQFYRHPLKPSYASHIYEKQADRYSGFEMAIIGATLEQSLLAMKFFGNDSETPTHPDKLSRLAEIGKGYIDARLKIFKDSSYIKQDSIFKMKELMSSVYEDKSFSEIQSIKHSSKRINEYSNNELKKSNTKQIYNFYGELIYLTEDMQIRILSNNQCIGNVLQPNPNLKTIILNLDGVKFYLDEGKIFSVNPDGFKLEVGNKIFN